MVVDMTKVSLQLWAKAMMADATTVGIAWIAIPRAASEIPFSIVDAFWERSETADPGAQVQNMVMAAGQDH